jgi:curli production assembly/transport component CsgG
LLTGCQTPYYNIDDKNAVKPVKVLLELEELPKPKQKITVAVYDFPDLTGAFKSNDAFAVYSKAVPQGADTIVIDALLKAGNGSWFNVLERKGLNSLVQERKISEVNHNIRKQSQQNTQINSANLLSSLQKSLGQKNVNFKINNNLGHIPSNTNNPLRLNQQANFGLNQQNMPTQNQSVSVGLGNQLLNSANYIIQGGIVGYDSDEVTSGGGLRLINIGGFGEIRKDVVTVNIRLVEVSTGNILLNKTLSKGIYSQKIQGSSFGYVDIDKILETEVGFSHNEPVFEALNLTIQTAVLDIIKQGIYNHLWEYADNVHQVAENSVRPEQKTMEYVKMNGVQATPLDGFY